MYELQKNGTHTMFQIKYGKDGEVAEKKEISKNHRML
jgi:hypothetical protein